ncbi:MAG TPA: hypothetical protein PLJ21_12155 [Pseudobdellovibrionaceae bacterium]|nr:hypothetical protein [Pseudobdellovibrionaceae bacterium]
MRTIIELLNEKNEYLGKFFSLNEVELKKFRVGDFDGLDAFYKSRENLLEIINYIDLQIEKKHSLVQENLVESDDRTSLRYAFARKDQWVDQILKQDLEVLSCIDQEKSNIIKELRDVRKSKKAVVGYKHKKFNQKLNEEY